MTTVENKVVYVDLRLLLITVVVGEGGVMCGVVACVGAEGRTVGCIQQGLPPD